MQTLIQHHGRTLVVDFEFNEKRTAVNWSIAVERALETVPLVGVITVLPADGKAVEDLVILAAQAGLAWLEKRSHEGDSLGRLVGYPIAIDASPPRRELEALGA